jgi:hypothetical protein
MLTGLATVELDVPLMEAAVAAQCRRWAAREQLGDFRGVKLDPTLLQYAASRAELGAKRVRITDACVARHSARRRETPERPELVKLRLRQRLETGRFCRSEPGNFPAELCGRWDGFVVADGLVFCLRRSAEDERSFDAETCFETNSLAWTVCCAEDHDRLGDVDVIVEVPDHAVERYMERVRSGAVFTRARAELRHLIVEHAILLPELPAWFAGECREDAPLFLALSGWFIIPLRFKEHSSFRYVAVTCLGRGMNALRNADARQAKRAERARPSGRDHEPAGGHGRRRKKGGYRARVQHRAAQDDTGWSADWAD